MDLLLSLTRNKMREAGFSNSNINNPGFMVYHDMDFKKQKKLHELKEKARAREKEIKNLSIFQVL